MSSSKRKTKKKPIRIKRHHIHAGLLMALVAVAVGFFIHTSGRAASCTAPFTIASPVSGTTVSGPINLQAIRQGTVTSGQLHFRIISPTVIDLGLAFSSDGNVWILQWSSTSIPDGQYQLVVADSLNCYSPEVTMIVRNTATTQQQLITQLAPTSWAGNTNVASTFVAGAQFRDSSGATSDVSSQAQYHWTTSLGSIASSGRSATYYSGPTAGTGTVTVVATYNGLTTQAQASVKVTAYVSSATSTTTTSGTTSTSTTGSTATQPATSTTSTSSTQAATGPISAPLDATTASCLSSALSQQRYLAIIAGTIAATADERLEAVKCFGPLYVIPARLAPVDPAAVRQLNTGDAKSLAVSKAATASKDGKKSIKLSGKAAPNTDVYIYVFSEPLVLTAKSDAQGNWSYNLENPLKPGDHQVYAVTKDSAGTFVRSESFPIQVAQAAPSGDNPGGNSLQLTTHDNSNLYIFVAIAALLVVFSIRVVFLFRRRNRTSLSVS